MGYQWVTTLVLGILAFLFGRFMGVQVRVGMALFGVDIWPRDSLRLTFEDSSWMSAGTGMVLDEQHSPRDFHEELRKFRKYQEQTALLFDVPEPVAVPRLAVNPDGTQGIPPSEDVLPEDTGEGDTHESCFLQGKCAIRYSCIKMQKAPAGGQPVCLDFIRDADRVDVDERETCAAYSFMAGTRLDWEFRLLRTSSCKVYVLNPMMSPDAFKEALREGKATVDEAKRMFHLQAGLPGMVSSHVPEELRLKREMSFGEIKKFFNHGRRILQIVRIDCGGCEFEVLKKNAVNKPFRMVRQLVMRLYKSQMTNPEVSETVDEAFGMLRRLVDTQSMELVHHEYTSGVGWSSSPENQNIDITFIMPRW